MASPRQNAVFITFASWCMSRYFFKTLFFYARPLPVQTKVHFENLQFLAVMYDMGVLRCASDVVLTIVCFYSFV